MSDSKIFAPEKGIVDVGEEAVGEVLEKKVSEKEKKRIKFIDATFDGQCGHCLQPYRTGDRIALFNRDPDPESTRDILEPFHKDCLDAVLLEEKEE